MSRTIAKGGGRVGSRLPSLLANHEEVARLTGMTLGLRFAEAFVGLLLGGGLLDLTGASRRPGSPGNGP
jgi:hypothetical protein